MVANFQLDEWPVEIFGQNRPVLEQNGFRHMVIEHLILEELGEDFRRQVVELTRSRIKTEPTFCRLLQLTGDDPYEALLNYGKSTFSV